MKRNRLIDITLILLLAAGCAKKSPQQTGIDDPRVVVQVGERKLTLGDVNKKYLNTTWESSEKEFEQKKDFAEKTLNRYLLIASAIEEGMKPQFDTSIYRRHLLQELYNRNIISKITVSDADVENYFKKYGGEVQMGQFAVRDSALAESLYTELKKGADFQQVLKTYLDDKFLVDRGGSRGYFQYGQFDDNIEEASFNLKIGEISRPVQTRYGWHIIKLYDRIKNSPEDLKANWNQYKDLAHQHKQKNDVAKYVDQAKLKYNYKFVEDNMQFVIHKADSIRTAGSMGTGLPSSGYLSAEFFTDDEKKLPLVQFNGGAVTIRDLLEVLLTYDPRKGPELTAYAVMDAIFEGMAMPIILEDMALKEGLDTLSSFKAAVEYYKDGTVGVQMRDKIMSQLQDITEEDMRAYYDSHPDDFFSPDQIRADAIAVKTEKEAKEILEKLQRGASFAILAPKYSLDKKTGMLGGDIGFFTDQRYTEIYRAAEGLKKGELGGPVKMYGNYWVFKLTDRIAKYRKEFVNARPEVTNRITIKVREDALNNWLDKKKATTKYILDLDLIKNSLITK